MTKADLIAAIADKTDMSREAAKNALDAFTDSVIDALKKGDEVRLVGFGTFLPVNRAAGMARNPRTGEQVQRPASKTARFRVGEGLKGALNGKK
ncbi:MAG TPA: HU family DNA-binding protein [Caulobacteraceae bacterium]|jgi:DNA-binding protein HU-beta